MNINQYPGLSRTLATLNNNINQLVRACQLADNE
ncbi:hypothetical protein CJA_2844 [Cellvibrio japonicus Ueda107]|uniref:Uncharacterized protein n=1 Tax=Cellvibrio japonicus (strain Ueda107) TaxID=498211 RepID=B3PC31_CELJU|nr:hypothetical protein CJA_2844 [Cellvibrio japonicus Ueda107]